MKKPPKKPRDLKGISVPSERKVERPKPSTAGWTATWNPYTGVIWGISEPTEFDKACIAARTFFERLTVILDSMKAK